MKKHLSILWAKLLTVFSDIKVFKWPMFAVYDPSSYAMDGAHIRHAISVLQPGDVVLRGYDHYADGYFIDDPLKYSHGGICVGPSTIVHAVAAGVSEVDAIDFMMCDRICILRPAKHKKSAVSLAKKLARDNVPYDFWYESGNSALYCYELVALCYKKLGIQKVKFSKCFGLLHRDAYLADSFRQSKSFTTVFEYNKKFNIDTTRR